MSFAFFSLRSKPYSLRWHSDAKDKVYDEFCANDIDADKDEDEDEDEDDDDNDNSEGHWWLPGKLKTLAT